MPDGCPPPRSPLAVDEVKITQRLRAAMCMVVSERTHPWGRQMVILPGTESLSRPSLPHPGGRTDMSILIVGVFKELKDHDPHARILMIRVQLP